MPAKSPFEGIIDIHAHADPDKTARSIDVFELARMYRDREFRGVLLMNHFDPTAGLAYLVQKYVPGIEVFGGIVLNRLVGGINPAAVEHFCRVEGGYGRIVYMPTLDAENEIRHSGSSAPFVRISEDGRLLPEVLDMLDLVAERRLGSPRPRAPDPAACDPDALAPDFHPLETSCLKPNAACSQYSNDLVHNLQNVARDGVGY